MKIVLRFLLLVGILISQPKASFTKKTNDANEIYLEQNHEYYSDDYYDYGYEKTDTNFALDELKEENHNLTNAVETLSQQVKGLLDKMNPDEKSRVLQLNQYINGNQISDWKNAKNTNQTNQNNNSSITETITYIIKNCSAPAIKATAFIICFSMTQSILLSGEISRIIDRIASIFFWQAIASGFSSIISVISGILPFVLPMGKVGIGLKYLSSFLPLVSTKCVA